MTYSTSYIQIGDEIHTTASIYYTEYGSTFMIINEVLGAVIRVRMFVIFTFHLNVISKKVSSTKVTKKERETEVTWNKSYKPILKESYLNIEIAR